MITQILGIFLSTIQWMKLSTENLNTTTKWRAPYVVQYVRDRERFRTQLMIVLWPPVLFIIFVSSCSRNNISSSHVFHIVVHHLSSQWIVFWCLSKIYKTSYLNYLASYISYFNSDYICYYRWSMHLLSVYVYIFLKHSFQIQGNMLDVRLSGLSHVFCNQCQNWTRVADICLS